MLGQRPRPEGGACRARPHRGLGRINALGVLWRDRKVTPNPDRVPIRACVAVADGAGQHPRIRPRPRSRFTKGLPPEDDGGAFVSDPAQRTGDSTTR